MVRLVGKKRKMQKIKAGKGHERTRDGHTVRVGENSCKIMGAGNGKWPAVARVKKGYDSTEKGNQGSHLLPGSTGTVDQ